MSVSNNEYDLSSDEEFEYITFVLERLTDILKLNFIIIMTIILAMLSIINKSINISSEGFLSSIFLISGVGFWIVTITLTTILFIQTTPTKIRNSSPLGAFETQDQFKKIVYKNNLNEISSSLGRCLALTNISGILLFIGAIEMVVRRLYGTYLHIVFAILFSIIIFMYFKYTSRADRNDPIYESKSIFISSYKILECLDDHGGQTIPELSSRLQIEDKLSLRIQTEDEYIQGRVEILASKNLVLNLIIISPHIKRAEISSWIYRYIRVYYYI